ncbi:MAG: efflux RND transporter permease subunit, partial [Gammaproteobacteria bacterium]
MDKPLGISGRIAAGFQRNAITPLLALVLLLAGIFATLITPKEEEPQIDVTMANVFVPFPGASAKEVENLVSTPAGQVLSEIDGVEHVYSTSMPGMSLVTVQFEVGVPRQEALVKLYNHVWSNADWLPQGLGVGAPLVKPKGIDDVPIMGITLSPLRDDITAHDLADVAHTLETELKRVPGTRDIYTLGAPDDIIRVTIDPARLATYGIDYNVLRQSLLNANRAMSPTHAVRDDQLVELRAGDFFRTTADVAALIIGTRGTQPVYLGDVADVARAPDAVRRSVWNWSRGASAGAHDDYRPALTVAIAKQPGQNAIDITTRVLARLDGLKGVAIPDDVGVSVTRNYGETAAAKSAQLIQKLLFATAAVVALVFFALGRREAFIVGSAVIITLAITLFASWAWGFTLNRVSLFALIFSIGILVDDAIVVVENIHRHMALPENAGKTLLQMIPRAVDEVGAPTILATFTVIAALMPMAFVSGLMGPYMSPIPINASTGMLISLAVAFIVTPWMAGKYLHHHAGTTSSHDEPSALDRFFSGLAQKLLAPLVAAEDGKRKRHRMYWGVLGAIAFAVALPVVGLVVLK